MRPFAITDATRVQIRRPSGDVREESWGRYRDALTRPQSRPAFERELSERGYTNCHGDLVRLAWSELSLSPNRRKRTSRRVKRTSRRAR